MYRWIIFLSFFGAVYADRACFVIPDPSECECQCCEHGACQGCFHCFNPYQYSEVDEGTYEPEPTWPTQMDAPFQDELSR